MTKRRALLSVSDKKGLIDFARGLVEQNFELVSTGGTFTVLKEAGIEVKQVSDITGFPEIMDGRVKTLHPAVHGGILANRSLNHHLDAIKEHNIKPIDLVCVNLYPFKETIAKADCTEELAIENIDIGGATMLRSAAKNFKDVIIAVDPDDYSVILEKIASKSDDYDYRKSLAVKVFDHTASYDRQIVNYFVDDNIELSYTNKKTLRYGENPQQKAYFYSDKKPAANTIAGAKQLQGKELSYNNIRDADAALEVVKEFSHPAVVAVKHMNPCGVGVGENIYEAYTNAYKADPVSIFGGIVALNEEVSKEIAEEMVKIFLEVIIAPSYSKEALEVLQVKPNLRLLVCETTKTQADTLQYVSVSGGLLAQTVDSLGLADAEFKVVTKKKPSLEEEKAFELAWKVVKHVKSNAIVLATSKSTIGIGTGQMNRVGSAKIALEKLDGQANVVLASDGFFPMGDTVELAAKFGIGAIIQPGGSIKDQDSIDVANKENIAMVTTGIRHFKH
ncbi:bifunctional phosphoribosylaminoimidazolecarboxamide formyltransferase/IMP cyclohydrolase [Gemella sp. zg-570]|uniref:bifunctional phosphoribosylaminoimidazolecarboxamide formyltransferase/IMP cyclohydrolase n=1 Tax=Gemella sp. zg-570 TaxID=2840371 RepID=UPI001C0E2172|nr:bifunctional phosphoribosylaminoimidazolecarboxamide formyltransferase/IMP cyclohydrolase [Gemella sp. zg-570]QWQ38870.1 bifunctional phosphoribosylaminoimidazolecarboxamide formyltransferase/IMP cyclohydrolase [Gemella sp. zg-570]